MRTLREGLLLLFLVTGASVSQAKDPPKVQNDGIVHLTRGLHAIANQGSSSGPPAKTVDKDQGDDHASLRAIEVVCSKNTPAARRSAICPVAVSPD